MVFASCDGIDMALGYALIFLAFLLSVFNIDSYNKLDDKDKSSHGFQFTIALITLIITVVYFLYMIKDPVMNLINKKK